MRFIFISLIVGLVAVLSWHQGFATHNLGGEIRYRCVDSTNFLTYEISVITYTKSDAVDRCEVFIFFGDGDSCLAPRVNGFVSPGSNGCPNSTAPGFCAYCGEYFEEGLKMNIYTCTHTYSGAGNFILSFQDENRNQGICNFVNSVDIPFQIDAQLFINPLLGLNNSAVLAMPPIDHACVGTIFEHSMFAYDPDGDSLSFSLVPCLVDAGSINPGPDNVTVNPFTGEFTWDAPDAQCSYSFAIRIKEWRTLFGDCVPFLVGTTMRDFEIQVIDCNNIKPEINAIDIISIMPTDTLVTLFDAFDTDNDSLAMIAGGEKIASMEATWELFSDTLGHSSYRLTWPIGLEDVRCAPYYFYFKAKDDGGPSNNPNMKLADFKTMKVLVHDSGTCPCANGIEENDYFGGFTVYPNPASDMLTINAIGKEAVFRDVLNKSLYRIDFKNGSASLDVSGLADGVYFLQVEGLGVKKIVVRK